MPGASSSGAVFVQTNEAQNRVLAFRRAEDGTLSEVGAYDTGGAGNGEPHLPSQGSVVLASDGAHLLATNAASDDVSAFSLTADGALQLLGTAPAGLAPRSVTERDGLVFVLVTGKPVVTGYRLGTNGLEPLAGGEVALPSADADPAQVGFTPDGSALLVTERGTNVITSIPVDGEGRLGMPRSVPSSGPTPYGFACTTDGTLVVTEAFGAQKGAAAASSYMLDGGALTPVSQSVGNGRSEICWAVITPDGRFAFTTNFADGAVSRYAIGPDGSLALDAAAAGITVDGRPGLRDEGLSADGSFLYAIDADAGSIAGWAVGEGGSLSPIGTWEGLPTTVAGLAAR